jgi:hypothetical protein
MIWGLLILAVVVLVAARAMRSSPLSRTRNEGEGHGHERTIAPGLSFKMEIVRPDPAAWAQEREEARHVKEASIERLRASFRRLTTVDEAFACMRNALASVAQVHGLPAADFDKLWVEVQQPGGPAKLDLAIRKKITETYKLRAKRAKLVEALAYCLLHVRFVLEHPDTAWKVATSIKRLVAGLDHEPHRRPCIGFLYVLADATRGSMPEVASLCDEEISGLFSSWHSDDEGRTRFQANVGRLAQAASASDKHFILNDLVEYLNRLRRGDPSVRAKLVEFGEQDVGLYKRFLTEFTHSADKRMPFAKVVEMRGYMCPSLPSFNALWDLYEEERNVDQLRRLQRVAKEIKYREFQIDESLLEGTSDPSEDLKTPAPARVAAIPTDIIEVARSGQKGKLAFLDSSGGACSIEQAAQDYFRQRGFCVLRGEVKFWQAMFGLTFWEEIFAETGAPNELNDIPNDLFAGDAFYAARQARIDEKAASVARGDLCNFILGQLHKHGGAWTRIIFDGRRGDFSYRQTLEGDDVREFLATIDPATFSKIVHRIARNPSDNRAGLPDYMIWKDGLTTFVEVKAVREKIRESQEVWLAWMQSAGIAARVVRVKAQAERIDAAT